MVASYVIVLRDRCKSFTPDERLVREYLFAELLSLQIPELNRDRSWDANFLATGELPRVGVPTIRGLIADGLLSADHELEEAKAAIRQHSRAINPHTVDELWQTVDEAMKQN